MKKFYIYLAIIILMFSQPVIAENIKNNDSQILLAGLNTDEVNLNLHGKSRQKLELNEPVKELNNELFTSKEDILKHYLEAQKKLDIEDIKALWESTVQRNPVIKFALKKLSLPAEQRRINSSRMAKTLSTLINGACMLPGLLGADSITSSAASAGGSLAGRAITKKTLPKEMPLTDTELIQLARLVEDLQNKTIKNYYSYKGNLEAYKIAKQNVVKHNRMYSKAFESNNLAQIITSKSLYDEAFLTEKKLKQKIKLNRLLLERLAGVEVVNDLNLGKVSLLNDLQDTQPKPEKEIKADKETKTKLIARKGKLDYTDINVKELAEEINIELEEEKDIILPDLRILWGAAVEKSETIRFAILKLSNPDGEVEKTTVVKEILSPLASVAPIVGLGFGDPLTAGSAMFGGDLLNSLLSDDNKRLSAKLSKVTDADLVMLAQETDTLQEKLVTLYYDYVNALMELNTLDKIAEENKNYLDITEQTNPELSCVASAFMEKINDARFEARQEILNKRVSLEQFVGNDPLLMVDKNLKDRLRYNF